MQDDQASGEGGLFAAYVNTFLRLKQQASGWTFWCTDDTTKERYINEYEGEEGIRLDREKIENFGFTFGCKTLFYRFVPRPLSRGKSDLLLYIIILKASTKINLQFLFFESVDKYYFPSRVLEDPYSLDEIFFSNQKIFIFKQIIYRLSYRLVCKFKKFVFLKHSS